MGVKRSRSNSTSMAGAPERKIIKKLPWSKAEDDELVKAVKSNSSGKINPDGSLKIDITWGEIAERIANRNAKQCRERWCFNLDPSIKREHWSVREDAILIKAQQTFGNQWIQVARFLKGRTENSVKTRYKSIIRAREREWTKEEDNMIKKMHSKVGSKWAVIQNVLPERSANAVKVRYRMLKKGLEKEVLPPGSPRQLWHAKHVLDDIDLKQVILEQSGSSEKATPPPSPTSVMMSGGFAFAEKPKTAKAELCGASSNLNLLPFHAFMATKGATGFFPMQNYVNFVQPAPMMPFNTFIGQQFPNFCI